MAVLKLSFIVGFLVGASQGLKDFKIISKDSSPLTMRQ